MRRKKQRDNIGESIAVAKLVSEQDRYVEDPGGCWDIFARCGRSDLVVDVEDSEDFDGRDAVQRQKEDDCKSYIEPDSGFLACLGGDLSINLRGRTVRRRRCRRRTLCIVVRFGTAIEIAYMLTVKLSYAFLKIGCKTTTSAM